MKNLLHAFVFLIISINSLQVSSQVTYPPGQNWKWLQAKPQGSVLRWCKMWDKNTWYMAGFNSTFLKTTDGGSSWVISYNAGRQVTFWGGQKADLFNAHFFDLNNGICIGSFSSAYKTTNGGVT